MGGHQANQVKKTSIPPSTSHRSSNLDLDLDTYTPSTIGPSKSTSYLATFAPLMPATPSILSRSPSSTSVHFTPRPITTSKSLTFDDELPHNHPRRRQQQQQNPNARRGIMRLQSMTPITSTTSPATGTQDGRTYFKTNSSSNSRRSSDDARSPSPNSRSQSQLGQLPNATSTEWLLQTASTLTLQAAESKGQAWLATRNSSTSLTGADSDSDSKSNEAHQNAGNRAPDTTRYRYHSRSPIIDERRLSLEPLSKVTTSATHHSSPNSSRRRSNVSFESDASPLAIRGPSSGPPVSVSIGAALEEGFGTRKGGTYLYSRTGSWDSQPLEENVDDDDDDGEEREERAVVGGSGGKAGMTGPIFVDDEGNRIEWTDEDGEIGKLIKGRVGGWVDYFVGWMDFRGEGEGNGDGDGDMDIIDEEEEDEDESDDTPCRTGKGKPRQVIARLERRSTDRQRSALSGEDDSTTMGEQSQVQAPGGKDGVFSDARWLLDVATKAIF
ncbi:hypothetical protein MMC25_006478 [Agyrium rufum]|nr:hypothetical protein [Agyrium rufum]